MMSYLNFKDQGPSVHFESTSTSSGSILRVEWDFTHFSAFLQAFQDLFQEEKRSSLSLGEELRLSLPNNWTVFMKTKFSGSRSLLAHPSVEEWVATLALQREDGLRWLDQLKELKAGQSSFLSDSVSLESVSNLEVSFSIAKSEQIRE